MKWVKEWERCGASNAHLHHKEYKLAAKPYYQMYTYANQEDRYNIHHSRNYENVLLIKLNTTAMFNIMKLMAHKKMFIKTKLSLQIKLITLDCYCKSASYYVGVHLVHTYCAERITSWTISFTSSTIYHCIINLSSKVILHKRQVYTFYSSNIWVTSMTYKLNILFDC
jgi:hypothetical protein